MTGATDW